ncbi:MAG: hypothetical protein EPN26_06075 [Rhodospirillales bacterium]|nr:MAG: hypothetical protein EPN26_06075 [Rhodospirillales bacterium]
MKRRLLSALHVAGLLLLLAMPVLAQPQGDLDRLLQQSLKAYGGEERLSRLSTLRAQGRITVKGQADAGRVERLFQAPDRLSSLTVYGAGTGEKRLLVKDRAWRNGQPASVPEHIAMSLQAARLRLPLLLKENRAHLIDQGLQEKGGRRFYGVTLPVSEGISLFVAIDAASGLILQTNGTLALADGTKAEFTTLYGDYRFIEGIAVALREDHYVQGAHTGTTVLEQVEINRPLPSGAFTP